MDKMDFYKQLLSNIKHLYPFESCNDFKCICFQTHCQDKDFFPAFDIERHKKLIYWDEEKGDVYAVKYFINVNKSCEEIGSRSDEDMLSLWKFLTFSPNIVEDLFEELEKKDKCIKELKQMIDNDNDNSREA